MVDKDECSSDDRPQRAGRSEIDALGSVIAASADMAERLRSEAASALLRRALDLLNERNGRPDVEDGNGETTSFIPS